MSASIDYGDPVAAAFWQHTRDHALHVPRCTACGRRRFPPRPACPHCRGSDSEWSPCSGRARLVSWAVVHHAVVPGWAERAPYIIALVAIEEDPTVVMYGNYQGDTALLREGLPLEAVFVDGEERTVVEWRPADGD